MVAGDICEAPPGPDGGVELPEAWPFPGTSNGLAGACLKPVDCGEDDFDDVSDCSASSAVDTAPRAISMAKPRQMPHGAAFYFPGRSISKRRAIVKKPTKTGLFAPRTVRRPRQLMPSRQKFPPIHVPRMLRNAPPLRRGALLIRGPIPI